MIDTPLIWISWQPIPSDHAGTADSLAAQSAGQVKSEDPSGHVISVQEIPDIPYEDMSVEQLQAVILAKMEKNGSVTERMRRDVTENIWHDSLVRWAKSF